jgi:hypothetical protein
VFRLRHLDPVVVPSACLPNLFRSVARPSPIHPAPLAPRLPLCLLFGYVVDRGDVPRGTAEIFFRKVKFWKGDAPPAFVRGAQTHTCRVPCLLCRGEEEWGGGGAGLAFDAAIWLQRVWPL